MFQLRTDKLRMYILLLLAMFMAETLSASISLHLPAPRASNMQIEHQPVPLLHHAAAHEHLHEPQSKDAGAVAATHPLQHALMHQAGHDTQHGSQCGSCHDCLSCFSVLPLSLALAATLLPQLHAAHSLHSIYYPPAIAQLQRPPIPSLA